jgi:two-component system KDP operon response regulator KdpE
MTTGDAFSDPATVLVVEDDRALSATLVVTLKAAGYRPVPALTAAEGLRWYVHYSPDIVLLDLGLPDADGLTLIESLRGRGATTPILVLSARDSEAMKVRALDLGADDYVHKPFGVDELLARLRAGLRHGVQARGSVPVVRVADLEVDLGRRRVSLGGAAVRLTPKEYDLLAELAVHRDRPVSHRELLAAVWGSERADIQYLRVYIAQLRQKLGADRILSTPGVGYQLASGEEGATA